MCRWGGLPYILHHHIYQQTRTRTRTQSLSPLRLRDEGMRVKEGSDVPAKTIFFFPNPSIAFCKSVPVNALGWFFVITCIPKPTVNPLSHPP